MVSLTFAADVETFDVASGDQDVFSFNLREGMSVEGSLSISGGIGDGVYFWITDPENNIVIDFGQVSQGTEFEFFVDQNGEYSLHFDNSFSTSPKNVVVTYEVFISGLNQTQLLLLAFLVIAIIVIGIIIILKKGRKSRTKCKTK
jgi:hypothetical protein